jgi:hypothetical protein
MRGLSSIYQVESIVDSATAAAQLVEGGLIDTIEVDTVN